MTTQASASLPLTHLLLALLVVAVWGTNFVVIYEGLRHFPPFAFAAMRFALAAFPALLVFRRPPAPLRYLAGYGLFIGVGQFGLLYLAVGGHIAPGLASLVVQAQVLFTIALSMMLSKEILKVRQAVALMLCIAGLALIALKANGDASLLGLALVLAAALSWSFGNMVSKSAGSVPMLPFVVWSSLFAAPPLALLSVFLEGPTALIDAAAGASLTAWATVAWQSVGNTLFGYAAWSWLLSRHPAALISPTALLVPVFGMSASSFFLGEPMPAWKLIAAALVIGGLAVNLVDPRRSRILARFSPSR